MATLNLDNSTMIWKPGEEHPLGGTRLDGLRARASLLTQDMKQTNLFCCEGFLVLRAREALDIGAAG